MSKMDKSGWVFRLLSILSNLHLTESMRPLADPARSSLDRGFFVAASA
jgi:hypothetical protein